MDGEVDGCSGCGAGTGGGGVDDGGSGVPVDGVESGGVDAGGCVDSGSCRSRDARRSSARRCWSSSRRSRTDEVSFSAISSPIFFNRALVSGEETSLELDGGGSVDGMVGDDGWAIDDWCGGGGGD